MPTALPRGLYLLTPEQPDTDRLLADTEPLLEAGIALLQYRQKHASADLRVEQASRLLRLCRSYRVPLIVNDDTHLAQAIGADGVHLGEFDADPRAARAALGPEAWVGVSCYDDGGRVARAVDAGADYVALGAFFASRSKTTTRRAHIDLLRRVAAGPQPVVAIGGITPDNAAPLIAAGAHNVAAIDAVYGAPDPVAAVRAFRHLFESTLPQDFPA